MQLQMILPRVEAYHIADQYENAVHSHDGHYQVTIPTKGTCYFTHEHKQMRLGAGDMLLLHPSDRHCFHIGDDAAVIIVIAEGEGLHAGGSALKDEAVVRKEINPQEAKSLYRRWMGSAFLETGELLAAQEAEQSILEDLRSLLRGDQAPLPQAGPKRSGKLLDPHLARAAEYIREHYAETIQIDELAAIALQSRFHFIRSFKAAVGLTPYQYVLHLRIEEAKRLLRETDSSVTEISYRLGFAAPSQFYRAFVKTAQATPEQYRSGI
ncbi:helix-turn-helix domain-containing protein [Paenibacillus thailandensis]|uniref:Helix-turn-helix domain-containing protein n=1 Tax=Paenibacillus thailandensis TaxID=393250 RepID=A0ABW5R177_9BACL